MSVPAKGSPYRGLRLAIAGVALVGALAAAAATPARSSRLARLTGDEPHYLLTAISIGEDRSLDVSDEQAAERYRPFHEVRLKPQGKLLEGGRLVSPHDPMLPALLAIPALLGGWMAARLTLALLAGTLAGLLLWAAVRRFEVPLRRAWPVVAVLTASAPLAIYGSQVYPEIPAALALAAGLVFLAGPLTIRGLCGLALSIVSLPWLGTKFIPVAAALAAIGIGRLVRLSRLRATAMMVALFCAAGLVYVLVHRAWYGGLTPYAAGAHFAPQGELSVVGESTSFGGRGLRLIGLLVDRHFGLAAWQPAWLLVIPALAYAVRRRPRGWHVLTAPLVIGWLTATFVALTMHGWWWPGRQVVVVLPAAALLIASWAGESVRRTALTAALGIVGVTTYLWTLVEAWKEQITLVVDFALTANPVYRLWSLLLPDYSSPSTAMWLRHGLWIAAASALAAAGAISRARPTAEAPTAPTT